MPKISAGLLLYRISDNGLLKILLVHPGGPYWKNKDEGAWTIPKGVVEEDEDLLVAAIREFTEETGLTPVGPFIPLGETKQKSGKKIYAWAFQGDCDRAQIRSNSFEIEWPPKSGKLQRFPEVDRADFFDLKTARAKILPSEGPFLDRLADLVQRS